MYVVSCSWFKLQWQSNVVSTQFYAVVFYINFSSFNFPSCLCHLIISKHPFNECFQCEKQAPCWSLIYNLKKSQCQCSLIQHSYIVLTLWELSTHTLQIVSKWIFVNLRQLADETTFLLRTNTWFEETLFEPFNFWLTFVLLWFRVKAFST